MVYVDTSIIDMDEINKKINDNNNDNSNSNNDNVNDEDIIDEYRIREIVREELTNYKPKNREKRPLNKWQIFLKECKEEQPKDLPYTEKVKVCSIRYKEKKNNND